MSNIPDNVRDMGREADILHNLPYRTLLGIHHARIEANMAPQKVSKHTRIYPASTMLPWPMMLLLYVTSEARIKHGGRMGGKRRKWGRGVPPQVSSGYTPCA